MLRVLVPIPQQLSTAGWDSIRVVPSRRETVAFLGHLRPLANHRSQVELAELSTARIDGQPWNAAGSVELIAPAPLQVRLPAATHHVERWDISVDFNDSYAIDFRLAGVVIASTRIVPRDGGAIGLRRLVIETPAAAVRRGYDTIVLRVLAGDAYASVGHLIPVDTAH